jgi:serine/threonine protein kinase
LIDFGLSKRFVEKNIETQKTSQINLKTVVGTPYYVAPEVLR